MRLKLNQEFTNDVLHLAATLNASRFKHLSTVIGMPISQSAPSVRINRRPQKNDYSTALDTPLKSESTPEMEFEGGFSEDLNLTALNPQKKSSNIEAPLSQSAPPIKKKSTSSRFKLITSKCIDSFVVLVCIIASYKILSLFGLISKKIDESDVFLEFYQIFYKEETMAIFLLIPMLLWLTYRGVFRIFLGQTPGEWITR